jgi:hypothetical protein
VRNATAEINALAGLQHTTPQAVFGLFTFGPATFDGSSAPGSKGLLSNPCTCNYGIEDITATGFSWSQQRPGRPRPCSLAPGQQGLGRMVHIDHSHKRYPVWTNANS